jgi:hypothetical protein
MQTYHVGLMALALFTVLSLLAYWSWVSRMRKQEKALMVPEFIEHSGMGENAQYVATIFADRPLDRVVAHGLAHRGRASISIAPSGVSICRTGERSFLIPQRQLASVTTGSAVIDRAVEKDGLISIRWTLGEVELETYLRIVSASERSTVLSNLKDLVA